VLTIRVAMVRHTRAQVVHEGATVVAGLVCESTQGGAHGRAHATLSAVVERHGRPVHSKRSWCNRGRGGLSRLARRCSRSSLDALRCPA
jgi:hypothetical protein